MSLSKQYPFGVRTSRGQYWLCRAAGAGFRCWWGPAVGQERCERKGTLLRWTPAGYLAGPTTWDPAEAFVLTPRSTVAAIRAGYVPAIHETAGVA